MKAGAALVPEVAAAVAGFANSTRLESGLYTLVDVGGGTVDCCTFNLFRDRDGMVHCPIFTASVQMLGVEPWSTCQDDPVLAAEFHYMMGVQQRGVIWRTKCDRYPTSDRWTLGLPLFLVGGGAASVPHRDCTHELNQWLKRHHQPGGMRVLISPAPEGLDHVQCASQIVHRLAVAIGLSLPMEQIPKIELPDAIPDMSAPGRRMNEDRYVDKDQV